MGLFDKIKGILFDEEEVEIPEIKKECKKEPVKKSFTPIIEEDPIKEIKVPDEDFKDSEYKSTSTFTFPIDFDEEDSIKIEEIEEEDKKPKETYREQTIKESRMERDFTSFLNDKTEKKKFTPTPIISPVYGVLDQNYKKEDVIVKDEKPKEPVEPTLDMVRKKAFGSLEDDLENTLTITKEIKVEKEDKKSKKSTKSSVVEEPIDKLKTIGELINEDEHSLEIPEIDGINEETEEYNNNSDIKENISEIKEDEIIDNGDTSEVIVDNDATIDDEEADLFSLIDSMYEEKGE